MTQVAKGSGHTQTIPDCLTKMIRSVPFGACGAGLRVPSPRYPKIDRFSRFVDD